MPGFSVVDLSLLQLSFGPEFYAVGSVSGASAADAAELRVPWQDLQRHPDVFALLNWRARQSGFVGREREVAELNSWVQDSPSISVKFLVGEGGAGKSRLAAEFATELQRIGWSAGFVDLRKPGSFLFRKTGTLLVIDYPEENRDGIRSFLLDLAAAGEGLRHPLRILFLTRLPLDAWYDTVLDTHSAGLIDTAAITLARLPAEACEEVYATTLGSVAKQLDLPSVGAPLGAVAEWVRVSGNANPLIVVAAAVHGALEPGQAKLELGGAGVLDSLVSRELSRLRNAANACGLPDARWPTAILALATIAGGLHKDRVGAIVDLLRVAFEGPSASAIYDAIETAGLSNGQQIAPLAPDLVAALAVHRILSNIGSLAPEVVWQALDRDTARGLERVGRMSHDASLLMDPGSVKYGEWLKEAIENWPERCAGALPFLDRDYLPTSLQPAAIAACKRVLSGPLEPNERARLLNNMSNHLWEIGRNSDGLDAIRECVALRRELAVSGSPDSQVSLAIALSNLSNRLGDAGDGRGALEASLESMELHRGVLANDGQGADPGLAASLNNYAIHASKAGDSASALKAISETVTIYRKLAADVPDEFDPDLAGALSNLALVLRATGENAGALKAIGEAVDITRALAEREPHRFEPNLSANLNNLSNLLDENEDPAGAFEAAAESAAIRRRLAAENPGRFAADFASALLNLSSRRAKLGDKAGALVDSQGALEIYERLDLDARGLFNAQLAGALNNLSNRLGDVGDKNGALDAIRKAVELRRSLAFQNPDVYEPALSGNLLTLSNQLGRSGDQVAALEAIRESVEIRERLARRNSGRFDADLAIALNNLSNRLMSCGNMTEAVAAIRRSVLIWRQLVGTDPRRFEPKLAMGLMNLATKFRDSGDDVAASSAIAESIVLYRRLSATDPVHREALLACESFRDRLED